ncbi:MAG: hypothetical protein ACXWV5_08500 [Flavitalea sp.]
MSVKFSCLVAASVFLFSCTDEGSEMNANKNTDSTVINSSNAKNCYQFVNNRDTVTLNTVNENGSISGLLSYSYFEKDKSRGSILGKMEGDLLVADYIFESEGTESVRQVAFKKSGDSFLEGYGDLVERDGKTYLKNTDSLDFSHSNPLKKIDCKD